MERSPDQIAEEAVKKFLAPKLKNRGELKRLRHHKRRSEAAQQIADQLSQTSEEWIDRIDYFLAEQLRRAVMGREAKRQQSKAITTFVQSDIDLCLNSAIDRGIEALDKEPKAMERLIENVAVEVQQVIQRAKQEFPQLESDLHLLEETYALPAVDQWLRRKLCSVQLARYHQEVSRTLQTKATEFEQAGRPEALREEYQTELIEALREVAGRAIDRLQREGIEERILSGLILHIEQWIEKRCDEKSLAALFG